MLAPPLNKGDTIGVMAPSAFVKEPEILAARKLIEREGYKVKIHPQTYFRNYQSAGTHEEKARALHELWGDREVRAIIAAGGGNRALHLLEFLDYDLFRAMPKHLIGFSDITALLNAVYAKSGLSTVHGPVFKNLPGCIELNELFDLLSGKNFSFPLEKAKVLRKGSARGPLIGGNLSVFHYLPNTEYMPEYRNSILFLEDWSEEISRIDRMFLHLRRCGVLEEISGLILGDFSLTDTGRPFGFSLEEIVMEHISGIRIPVISGAPFGHGPSLSPLPVGAGGELEATDTKITLNLTLT
jgi:muramoyltetrapeptide carboxypeptidase